MRGLPKGVPNRVILQGKYAQSFIDLSREGDKPFFLYPPVYGPHIPLIKKSDPYYKNFLNSITHTTTIGEMIVGVWVSR